MDPIFRHTKMVIPRHRCEKCLEYMNVEKNGDNYILRCLECEKRKELPEK